MTADQAILTALGNDVGFELVFARQLIARAKPATSRSRCRPAAARRT
ncbi:putative phosphoheptose isomerase [Mycobacterium xenopi 4042]|uniref:Putative phosphoheptose isomerase n=1 Tax=Mycobacterium xenopi 4042 TaxID=1299334 RepID=X7Z4R4_MYCXE|nr:putative phosphoheptose isomerase [Mycobacterium xenopi 4042]